MGVITSLVAIPALNTTELLIADVVSDIPEVVADVNVTVSAFV